MFPTCLVRPPISLRVVGLLALLLSSGCGPRDGGMNDYAKAQEATQQKVGSLTDLGAKVTRASSPGGEYFVVDLSGKTITDDHVRRLIELERVGVLNLSRSTVTDAHIAALHEGGVTRAFHKVDLSHTAVTDTSLDKLPGCKFLAELNLTGSKVTKAGVERFKQARQADSAVGPMFKNTKILF